MGRIKTTLVKRTSRKLFEQHPDKFKPDFNENKAILAQFIKVEERKKLRNIIAGYITRLVKREADSVI